ncbi:hypothetical protein Tco_0782247 [Tanacetum coccineum]
MLSDIEDSHGPSDAMHNPSQPLKVGKTLFQNSQRFTHFYQLSHSELVDIEKVALSSSLRSLKSKCTIESRAKKRSSINLIRTLVKLNLFPNSTNVVQVKSDQMISNWMYRRNDMMDNIKELKLQAVCDHRNSPNIPKRLEKDYHSIKDDVPLVSANTIGNVLVRGMLILDVLLTAEIIEMDDFKEITPSAYRLPTVSASPLVTKKRKQICRIVCPSSHKDNPKVKLLHDDDEPLEEYWSMKGMEIDGDCPDLVSHTNYFSMTQTVQQVIEIDRISVEINLFISKSDTLRQDVQGQGYLIQGNGKEVGEELRHKFEKSSTSNTSCREDDFHSHHDEHQDDDAPPEGEKRVKMSKMSKRLKSARDSSSKNSRKDSTTYVSKQQSQHQEWDAWEEENVVDEDEYGNTKEKKYIFSLHKIHTEEFLEPNLEEKLNRWVQKEFKTFNEDARLSIQHWKDSWHKREYKQNQKKVRKNPKDYYSNHRANDKPDSFSEADFKYLNKNDIEDLYYLCRSKEIDNRKVKLMNSLITFIRKHVPYTIVDEPQMGLIYLNSKDEKRVMYLEELVKFCDATLEKVLNEVKLRMFESKFLKKPPLLGELDQDIMKAYER